MTDSTEKIVFTGDLSPPRVEGVRVIGYTATKSGLCIEREINVHQETLRILDANKFNSRAAVLGIIALSLGDDAPDALAVERLSGGEVSLDVGGKSHDKSIVAYTAKSTLSPLVVVDARAPSEGEIDQTSLPVRRHNPNTKFVVSRHGEPFAYRKDTVFFSTNPPQFHTEPPESPAQDEQDPTN